MIESTCPKLFKVSSMLVDGVTGEWTQSFWFSSWMTVIRFPTWQFRNLKGVSLVWMFWVGCLGMFLV